MFPPPPLLCSPLSELLSLDEKLKEEEVDLLVRRRSERGGRRNKFFALFFFRLPPLPSTKSTIAKCHESKESSKILRKFAGNMFRLYNVRRIRLFQWPR